MPFLFTLEIYLFAYIFFLISQTFHAVLENISLIGRAVNIMLTGNQIEQGGGESPIICMGNPSLKFQRGSQYELNFNSQPFHWGWVPASPWKLKG